MQAKNKKELVEAHVHLTHYDILSNASIMVGLSICIDIRKLDLKKSNKNFIKIECNLLKKREVESHHLPKISGTWGC